MKHNFTDAGLTWVIDGLSVHPEDYPDKRCTITASDVLFTTAVEALCGMTGRVERSGDYQTIWRATIEADVFIHSRVGLPGWIEEVDLCEVRGCVPIDFILWAEEHKTDEEVTEAFVLAQHNLPQLDEAYTVELTYYFETSEPSGWCIEEVVPKKILCPNCKGERDE